MILDLDEIKLAKLSNITPSLNQPHQGQVTIKVIMTRTEIKTYPNGDSYYSSKTWEVGKPMVFKRKVKKVIAVKKIKEDKEEVY